MYFLSFVLAESNISYISITDDISSTWRPFYDKIPSEVVFLGQRESNSVKVNINSNELFTVCEVEAIGKILSLKSSLKKQKLLFRYTKRTIKIKQVF